MKKIKKFLLGRATIVALAIVLQLLWILSILDGFIVKYSFINTIINILAIVVVMIIVNKKSNPSYKLVWTFVIMCIPIVGLVIYLIFGRSELTRKTRKRMEAINVVMEKDLPSGNKYMKELYDEDKSIYNQVKYINDWTSFPIYRSTSTKYYKTGEAIFADMLTALEEAEHFIFLEFFIVEEGIMFNQILDILRSKVEKGVDVRFIYDDFGCVTTLPAKYYKQMQSYGIKCVKFNPLYPVMSVIMNNRDHRKIVVVDGKVGFTGGINLADEYINVVERFGYWKDTGLRMEGDAVWSLTIMFLEMWCYINKMPAEDISKFRPRLHQKGEFSDDGYVQPYADSPLDYETVGENIYMNIINRAKKYVYIFTPYLILDHEMIKCLQNSAKSGVDVRIVMPGIPDKKVVYWMGQSYYEELLACGVKIYQYKPGFMHAKSFVCDDEVATVGTINMDYRSFYLHFECGVWMYKSTAVMQVKEDVIETVKECEEITMEFCRKRPAVIRSMLAVLKIFAPLL